MIGSSSATEYPALLTPTQRLKPVAASQVARKTETPQVVALG